MFYEIMNWEITEAMIKYGGSFVKGLGELHRKADDINKIRLKKAFPEYWAEYKEIAINDKIREMNKGKEDANSI